MRSKLHLVGLLLLDVLFNGAESVLEFELIRNMRRAIGAMVLLLPFTKLNLPAAMHHMLG